MEVSLYCQKQVIHSLRKKCLEDVVYDGEMNAHHYFKNFGYCHSDMTSWLLIVELLSRRNMLLMKKMCELHEIKSQNERY